MADENLVSFLPMGAIIQAFRVGGHNIVQGFPTQELYAKHNTPYFGETIGRVANRIAGAKIQSLNGGQSYPLAANNGPNNLHGGNEGWGKKIWEGPTPVGLKEVVPGLEKFSSGGETVRFSLVSPDGDEGFPGTVKATVEYTVGKQMQDGKEVVVLAAEYEAELVDHAEETVINMTNHSYFNLTGGRDTKGTVVKLCTDTCLPLDSFGIPNGGIAPFSGAKVAEDFVLGEDEEEIDDCFVVNTDPASVPMDTRFEPLKKLVSAHHPSSGVHLEVYSTEPAFQFYTGKYIDVPAVEGIQARGKRSGFCVEPSRYVNAINEDAWKGMMVLKKGEKYGCRFVYRAWIE